MELNVGDTVITRENTVTVLTDILAGQKDRHEPISTEIKN